MIAQAPRDPWRTIWQAAIGDWTLATLLLCVAAGLAIAAWLPQTPESGTIPYAQWLSEMQVRFGSALPTLRTLGLFTVVRSLGFRMLLALLAGCLLLRLIEGSDRLLEHRKTAELEEERHAWPWADLFLLLAYTGGLLLLGGLLVTHVWGWQVSGQVVQSGDPVTLPGTTAWVAVSETPIEVTHSPTIVTFVEEYGPGIRAQAVDHAGRLLSLQQAAETTPVTRLTVALTEDRYFGVPEADLVVRLARQPGRIAGVDSPVLAQVYRSPPGRLTTETIIEGDAELSVDDVTLTFTRVPYVRLTALFNPGRQSTGIGLVLLAVGLLGSVMWSVRRSHLQEGADRPANAGTLPQQDEGG